MTFFVAELNDPRVDSLQPWEMFFINFNLNGGVA